MTLMLRNKLFEALKAEMDERVALAVAAMKDSPGMVTMIETHLEEDVSVASRLLTAGVLRHEQYCKLYDIQTKYIREKNLGVELRRVN